MDAQEISRQFSKLEKKLVEWGMKPLGFSRSEYPKTEEEALGYLLHIMPRCRGMITKGQNLDAAEKLGFMRGVIWVTCFATIQDLRRWRQEG